MSKPRKSKKAPEPVLPPEEQQRKEFLQIVNNLLEYSIGRKGEEAVAVRAVTETHFKVVTNKGSHEIYMPVKSVRARRKGPSLQVLSILKRVDRNQPVKWDPMTGQPLTNLALVDDMRQGNRPWFFAIPLQQIALIRTKGRPGL